MFFSLLKKTILENSLFLHVLSHIKNLLFFAKIAIKKGMMLMHHSFSYYFTNACKMFSSAMPRDPFNNTKESADACCAICSIIGA